MVRVGQSVKVRLNAYPESVLEGNIQRSGDQVRVRVSLVRVADGRTLWTSQFDEKVTNVFAAQDSTLAIEKDHRWIEVDLEGVLDGARAVHARDQHGVFDA